jgi:hypothetical protein
MMASRYAVSWGASLLGFALGATVLIWGVATQHGRAVEIGGTLAVGCWVTGIAVWAFGRANCMINAYRAGYRAGRNDANSKLLEDGLWLSAKAEQDARRALGDNDDLV